MIAGQRVVVDTGVSEYEPGEQRHYARSTKAHNTVSVDGGEQSEIWGAFRVARRAKKRSAKAVHHKGGVEISGSYEGFFNGNLSAAPRFRHNRQINVKFVKDGMAEIGVVDTIDPLSDKGTGRQHSIESYIHLHPDVGVSLSDTEEPELFVGDSRIGKLTIDSRFGVALQSSNYCPEFGVIQDASCIALKYSGELPVTLNYCFHFFAEK